MVVFIRRVLVQIKMRRPQEQTLDQQARDQTGKICAKQNTSLAGGNNLGGEDREKTFCINGLYRLVRSEGGRICCDFNGLSEWTGS
jgi:hypothetical protein